jgi:hypothetical protein
MANERKRRQQEITSELIHMFDEALYEAQSLWLSDYCCSNEEERERIAEDEKIHHEFLSLLTALVKLVK